jgi:hypothetical protein
LDMVSVTELKTKIEEALDAKAREEGTRDLQRLVDQWVNTNMVSVFVFTNAFQGMTFGQRQVTVLGWLSHLPAEEQNRIATFLLQTRDEMEARNTGQNLPSSGWILDLNDQSA